MATLLLNASYEPLRVISYRRAVVLILQERADVVEEGERQIRSAKVTMPEPVVIRLRYMVKVPYKTKVQLNRRNVLARDGGKCAYCSKPASTIDHVMPRSRGGKHEWSNVVAACSRCNSRKDDKLLSELGWTLPFTPHAPRGQAWLVFGLREVVPEWEPYLLAA